jgi:hypothetical protein
MDAYTKFIIQRCTTTYDPKKLLRGKNYSGKDSNRAAATSTFVDNYKVHQRRPYDDSNVRNILNFENCHITSEYHHDIGTGSSHDIATDDTRDVCTGTNDAIRHCDTSEEDRDVDVLLKTNPPSNDISHSGSRTKSRVMIASVVNMAVASMIFPGDVVTHINGIELHDYTVDDIIALICSLFDSEAALTLSPETHSDNDSIVPPPPPPPSAVTTSSPIAHTLSILDETINLFTSASSTSMDTDRSHFFAPPSPRPLAPPDQFSHLNHHCKQKVLPLQFVFNADVAVAKALQLRATAIQWQQQ